jgi:hypothetical protein
MAGWWYGWWYGWQSLRSPPVAGKCARLSKKRQRAFEEVGKIFIQ